MKILVIEDDENKLKQICDLLITEGIDISQRKSYQSGLKEIRANNYDLVLLDMSMPTYEKTSTEQGGRFRKFGGKEILSEIKRSGISARIFLVTAFDTFGEGSTFITLRDLNKQLLDIFHGIYLGSVFYNVSETNWSQEIIQIIKNIRALKDV